MTKQKRNRVTIEVKDLESAKTTLKVSYRSIRRINNGMSDKEVKDYLKAVGIHYLYTEGDTKYSQKDLDEIKAFDQESFVEELIINS